MLYNAAISACEKGEQWQQALDLFVAEQRVELLPDVITCNTSIACEKREQWQQALGLLGSLDVFPNSVTYSAAISACEKGSHMPCRTTLQFVPVKKVSNGSRHSTCS